MNDFIIFLIVFILSATIAGIVSYYLTERQNARRGDRGRDLRKPPGDISLDL